MSHCLLLRSTQITSLSAFHPCIQPSPFWSTPFYLVHPSPLCIHPCPLRFHPSPRCTHPCPLRFQVNPEQEFAVATVLSDCGPQGLPLLLSMLAGYGSGSCQASPAPGWWAGYASGQLSGTAGGVPGQQHTEGARGDAGPSSGIGSGVEMHGLGRVSSHPLASDSPVRNGTPIQVTAFYVIAPMQMTAEHSICSCHYSASRMCHC